MNFNQQQQQQQQPQQQQQLPQHLQQQMHLQMLQQQRQNLQQFNQQQQQQQQQLQMPPNQSPLINQNNLSLQQQQLIANQRMVAAMKQQQAQAQVTQQQVQAHQQAQIQHAKSQHSQSHPHHHPLHNHSSQDPNAQTFTKPLEKLTYWSEKLEKEGVKDQEVLLYEQIISRDLGNRTLLNKEREEQGNKPLLQRLIRDLKFYNDLKIARMKTIQFSSQGQYTNSIWGEGYQGYGNGFTDGPTKVLLPNYRKKPSRLNDINISKSQLKAQSQLKDEFVPIRLEFESERDRFTLRDTFLWNLNEQNLTLENLTSILIEDYKFSNSLIFDAILSSMKEQVQDYHRHVYNSNHGDDLRIIVQLDITISNNQLIDQFEWDISNPENSPEEFATILTEELSLPPEFITAIAHSIREQAQVYIKSLYLIGYDFKGGFIDEDEIRSHLCSVVTQSDYLRPRQYLPQYTPQLLEVSNNDLERLDKDRERDSRRKRRQGRSGRRGGPILPDLSDVPRTFRTPIPSTILPGGIDFGPDVKSYHEVVETINVPNDYNKLQDAINPHTSVGATTMVPPQVPFTPGSNKSTPRVITKTIKKRVQVLQNERGSRLIVSIKL